MECCLPIDDRPDNDLVRELYARFGLAYYQSECLHRGLCFILALSELPSRDLVTRPRVEERLAQAFSLTLGDVAAKVEAVLPAGLSGELQKAVTARNFLAHHFWFERAHLMFSVENVRKLIAELDDYSKLFDCLDTRVDQLSKPKHKNLGSLMSCSKRAPARSLRVRRMSLSPTGRAYGSWRRSLPSDSD